MRTIFAATVAAFLLSACAGNPEIASVPVAQPAADECQALIWDGRGTLPENYDCDTEMGNGTYHLTVWSNNGRNVQRIKQYSDYQHCAMEANAIGRNIRAVQSPDGQGFYTVNEVWCVRQAG